MWRVDHVGDRKGRESHRRREAVVISRQTLVVVGVVRMVNGKVLR